MQPFVKNQPAKQQVDIRNDKKDQNAKNDSARIFRCQQLLDFVQNRFLRFVIPSDSNPLYGITERSITPRILQQHYKIKLFQ